jgi:hypothetical protein
MPVAAERFRSQDIVEDRQKSSTFIKISIFLSGKKKAK